ncbi:nickel transport protein [Paucidesulfovibrio gracilis DSM 16080]|uniref:Nickel transport protein n=1 Tax=Paucidesulfovibrio gracilis DSM 16080 TaxID=1121449 RepID=A0A1T4XFD4_9BACT|nr:hypothetical protein [Paucidesulfovibrio gracilis]SKA88266.1 nickel transport protein [Paucidesulfovibrio gracilis DSM 16080]
MRTLLSCLAALLFIGAVLTGPTQAATLDDEDLQRIERLVDKSVAKRLAPVQRSLAMMRDQGVTPTEVAGGIGYIVGIGGLLAYAASRRRRD